MLWQKLTKMVHMVMYKQAKWHNIADHFDALTKLAQRVHVVMYKQVNWQNVDHFDALTKLTQMVHMVMYKQAKWQNENVYFCLDKINTNGSYGYAGINSDLMLMIVLMLWQN